MGEQLLIYRRCVNRARKRQSVEVSRRLGRFAPGGRQQMSLLLRHLV